METHIKLGVPVFTGEDNAARPQHKHFDRHGNPVYVGSAVRIQECAGRYGQTRVVSGVIENIDKWNGVKLKLSDATKPFTVYVGEFGIRDFSPGNYYYITAVFHARGIAYHKHNDVEHAHETWLELA